jgi:hypothetical protein
LALLEGDTVDLMIDKREPACACPPTRTQDEADYAQRLEAAQSLEEMFTVMASAPRLPEGYDLCQALNANRQAAGERLLFPGSDHEGQS